MAGRALPGEACMVHRHRLESKEIVMTGIALGAGGNMGIWLAQSRGVVMASRALSCGRRIMHEGDRGPTGVGFVAGITLRAGADMGGRFSLSILA